MNPCKTALSRSLFLLLLLFVRTAAATESGESAAPWYPSQYGAEDTLGALNNLSPEGVLKAARLVTTGRTYALGGITGRSTPAYVHRSFELFDMPHGAEISPP